MRQDIHLVASMARLVRFGSQAPQPPDASIWPGRTQAVCE
jgi:hypothetical protein